jgi:hypothetical protein
VRGRLGGRQAWDGDAVRERQPARDQRGHVPGQQRPEDREDERHRRLAEDLAGRRSIDRDRELLEDAETWIATELAVRAEVGVEDDDGDRDDKDRLGAPRSAPSAAFNSFDTPLTATFERTGPLMMLAAMVSAATAIE